MSIVKTLEQAIEFEAKEAKNERYDSISRAYHQDLHDWLSELRDFQLKDEMTDEEKRALELINEVEDAFIDELTPIIMESSIEELQNMNYDDDPDDPGYKLYHRIGEVLFDDHGEYIRNKMERADDYMRRNEVRFQHFDGKYAYDSHEYLFYENRNDRSEDLKWLRVNEKFNIAVDKLNEFGW